MKPPIITLSPVCTKARVLMLPRIELAVGAKIVHFRESNAGGVVYTAYDRGVVTCWQLCDDCRFPSVARSVAAASDIGDLIAGDNPADDRSCRQLSLEAIKAPVLLCSSNVGLAKALGTPYWVSSGPMARIMTLFGSVP